MDLKKVQAIFVEEAMEHLEQLETGLLELEKRPTDGELLNAIFRSAHTIKGSSGTLGFKDIARFTHIMEEILDAARSGKLTPEKSMITVLLEAVDIIREMISAIVDDATFEFDRCKDLMSRMEQIRSTAYTDDPVKLGKNGTNMTSAGGQLTGMEARIFMITFVPAPELFKRGLDPSMVIDDLKSMGEVFDVKGFTDGVPRLSQMDPEILYLKWRLKIKTDKSEQAIRKVFDFVEEGSEITITQISETTESIPNIGELLIEDHVVTQQDIDEAVKKQKKLGEILVDQGKASKEDVEKALDKQNLKKTEAVKKAVSSSIRVDLNKLDHLVNLVGEMVIIHSMFQQTLQSNAASQMHSDSGSANRMDGIYSQLQRIGRDIQESTMALRMLPVGEVFQRFTRLVRELSANKGKKIDLVISGEDTELDKGVLEKIADPLVHLIRNSIDHGIETPEERAAENKPVQAMIHLRAYQQGDAVYIEVKDDGRGLDKEKIIAKAVTKGIIISSVGMTDEQIYNLIFLPGFSTADAVTDVSGRGVGMDVVRKNIDSLSGSVHIKTKPKQGTTISIRLPLTLAIIDGLTVSVGSELFIIPINSIVESLRPAMKDINTIEEKGEVVNVRGEYIPLVRLNNHLNVPAQINNPWEGIVVVTQYDKNKCGLLVDSLVGEQQVVLKNLGKATPKVKDIAGGTIMGDGRVALVLDVPGIVEMART